jgi:hypothetical protein
MSITPLAGSRRGFRSRLRCCLVLSTALLVNVWTQRAQAEVSEADRATARALAEEGNRALQAKNYELAEDRFRRADALIHAPSLVVDLARSLVGSGRIAAAYRYYDQTRKEQLPASAPASWKRAVSEAEREIKPLESKVAWLTLTIVGPVQPAVSIGEEDVPAFALSGPFAAEPGEHTLRVEADGYVPKELPLSLKAGEKRAIELDLEPVPVTPVAPPPAPRKAPPKREPAPPPPAPAPPNPLAYAALGVGAAGFAASAVTFVLFLAEKSKLKSLCPSKNGCPIELQGDVNREYAYSYTSGVSLVVGVVGAGAGTLMLLRKSDSGQPVKQKGVSLAPFVFAGGAGLQGTF